MNKRVIYDNLWVVVLLSSIFFLVFIDQILTITGFAIDSNDLVGKWRAEKYGMIFDINIKADEFSVTKKGISQGIFTYIITGDRVQATNKKTGEVKSADLELSVDKKKLTVKIDTQTVILNKRR